MAVNYLGKKFYNIGSTHHLGRHGRGSESPKVTSAPETSASSDEQVNPLQTGRLRRTAAGYRNWRGQKIILISEFYSTSFWARGAGRKTFRIGAGQPTAWRPTPPAETASTTCRTLTTRQTSSYRLLVEKRQFKIWHSRVKFFFSSKKRWIQKRFTWFSSCFVSSCFSSWLLAGPAICCQCYKTYL